MTPVVAIIGGRGFNRFRSLKDSADEKRVRDLDKDRPTRRLPLKWKLQLATFAIGIFLAAKGFEHGMPVLGWVSVGAVAIAVLTSVSKHQCPGCGYPTICFGGRQTSFCPKCGKKDEAIPEQGLPQ